MLTIPPSVPYASAIRVAVYCVVLWNNVVHGLLMERFASRLGLLANHQHEEEYDRLLVEHTRLQAAFRALITHRDELPAMLYEERKAALQQGLDRVEERAHLSPVAAPTLADLHRRLTDNEHA